MNLSQKPLCYARRCLVLMQSERKTFYEVISYFKLQLRGKGEGKFRESKQAIRSVLDGGQKGWAKTSLIQWANKQPLVGGKKFLPFLPATS